MINTLDLAKRLEQEHPDPFLSDLQKLLQDPLTKLISDRASKVSVSEARRLWGTREENTDITGLELRGAERLLSQLTSLAPQRKLEQFALVGSEQSGNLFFDGSTHRFVGAVLFESRGKPEQPALEFIVSL